MKNNPRSLSELDSHLSPDKDRQAVNQNDALLREALSSLNGVQLTQRQEEQFSFLLNEHRNEIEGQASSTRYLVLLLVLSFVLPAGPMSCAHVKRALSSSSGSHYTPTTEAEALGARENGNYLVARAYFNKQLCDITRAQDELCREDGNKGTSHCEKAARNVDVCEDVEDKVAGMIDYFMNQAGRHNEAKRYLRAIFYTDQALDALDEDNYEEERDELNANREEYQKQIELIRQAYPDKLQKLQTLANQNGVYSTDTWQDIQNRLEALRLDRDEIQKADPELFNIAIQLARKLYQQGDYNRAKRAIWMAGNIDLAKTSFYTGTQITTETNALEVAIKMEMQDERDEQSKAHEKRVGKYIYTIEVDFNKPLALKMSQAKRKLELVEKYNLWTRIVRAWSMGVNVKQKRRLRKMEKSIEYWKSKVPGSGGGEDPDPPIIKDPPPPPPPEDLHPSLEVKAVAKALKSVDRSLNAGKKQQAILALAKALWRFPRNAKLRAKREEMLDTIDAITSPIMDEADDAFYRTKDTVLARKKYREVLQYDPLNKEAKSQIKALNEIEG